MDRSQIIRIIHDYMSRYEKKNKSDSQKCIRLPLSFYFFYGLSFLYILISMGLYFF